MASLDLPSAAIGWRQCALWLALAMALGIAPAGSGAEPDASGRATVAAPAERQDQARPELTGKERLSGKAADEQRVNDCKVPATKRTRPRPTCAEPAPSL